MTSHVPPPGDAWQKPPLPHDADAQRDGYVRHAEPLLRAGDQRLEPAAPHEAARPRKRRIRLPLILFLATCLSTWWAGAVGLYGLKLFELLPIAAEADGAHYFDFLIVPLYHAAWNNGLIYMCAVMGILLAHEMGHFLMTLRHRIPASLPFFIPVPFPPIGTMGAVIAMQGSRADRKQLFDIGLAGPLVGLVVALPVLCAGVYTAEPVGPHTSMTLVTRLDGGEAPVDRGRNLVVSQPLLTHLLLPALRPDLAGKPVRMNALLLAGWVGLLITGLNMMPLSQLDGGHVAYALLRRRAHHLATACLLLAIVYIVASAQTPWVLMLVLIVLIGIYHPPTANDYVRLGKLRTALGWASLTIPVLCLPPRPFEF